jgi:hypothetical protein
MGLILQRNWADIVYPWLLNHGYVNILDSILVYLSEPFDPYIVWKMDAIKFPINSFEIYFIAMCFSILAYTAGSLLIRPQLFELQKILNREDKIESRKDEKPIMGFSLMGMLDKVVGIDQNYTFWDKVIAWSVMAWTFGYSFLIMFVGVILWNIWEPWSLDMWSNYFFTVIVVSAIVVGAISTVWFLIGGSMDLRRLFLDLATRKRDPLDNGQVYHTAEKS